MGGCPLLPPRRSPGRCRRRDASCCTLSKRDDIGPRPPSVSLDVNVEDRQPAEPRVGGPRTRDIERYAALFAERTKVMRSSAMRDLMALTEREDVISLAGGLPDTSTFPPDSYASLMNSVSVQSCARALQYGPTDGLTLVKSCIADVMAAEGMHVDSDEILV